MLRTPLAVARACAVGGVAASAGLSAFLVPQLSEMGTAAQPWRYGLGAGALLLMVGAYIWTGRRLAGVVPDVPADLSARQAAQNFPFLLSRLLFAAAVISGTATWLFLAAVHGDQAIVTGLITYLLLVFPLAGIYLIARRALRQHAAGPPGAAPLPGYRQSVRMRLTFALQLPVIVCAVGIVLVEQSAGTQYDEVLEDDYRGRYVYLLDRMLRGLQPSVRAKVESELRPPQGVIFTNDHWVAVPAEQDRDRPLDLRLPPLLVLLLVTLLAGLLGRWLAGEITHELASLRRALSELRSGDLHAASAARPEHAFGLRESADLFKAFAQASDGFASQRGAIRDAAKRRRAAEQAKARFLAHLSHELKSPLNSILGFSELMLAGLDGPITDRQRTRLSLVWRAGESLLRFILVLLDLARLEVPLDGDQRARPTGLKPSSMPSSALVKHLRAQLRPDPTDSVQVAIVDRMYGDVALHIDLPHTTRALLLTAGTLVDVLDTGTVNITLSGDAETLMIDISVQDAEGEEADRTRLLQRLAAPFETLPGLATKRFNAPAATLMLANWVFEAQHGRMVVERTSWPRFRVCLPVAEPETPPVSRYQSTTSE